MSPTPTALVVSTPPTARPVSEMTVPKMKVVASVARTMGGGWSASTMAIGGPPMPAAVPEVPEMRPDTSRDRRLLGTETRTRLSATITSTTPAMAACNVSVGSTLTTQTPNAVAGMKPSTTQATTRQSRCRCSSISAITGIATDPTIPATGTSPGSASDKIGMANTPMPKPMMPWTTAPLNASTKASAITQPATVMATWRARSPRLRSRRSWRSVRRTHRR